MVEFAKPTHATELSREEEADLLIRMKAGDQVACTKLVTLFGPQMMTIARRFMRCEDDCNDALQDAFISAFKALDRFQADSRLSTWLHSIAVNACLMKLRKDSYHKETSIEELLFTMNWRGGFIGTAMAASRPGHRPAWRSGSSAGPGYTRQSPIGHRDRSDRQTRT